jgi:hypothetical protein
MSVPWKWNESNLLELLKTVTVEYNTHQHEECFYVGPSTEAEVLHIQAVN